LDEPTDANNWATEASLTYQTPLAVSDDLFKKTSSSRDSLLSYVRKQSWYWVAHVSRLADFCFLSFVSGIWCGNIFVIIVKIVSYKMAQNVNVSIRLLVKQIRFAGHCMRSKQPISELLLYGIISR
jgi:hypothetical protein